MTENLLLQALVYLTAGVVAAPIAKRLGLGSVLGYLIAGIVVGPFALSLVGEQEDVMKFAEFGVVILLFMLVPIPRAVLDAGISVSITSAVIVLMTVLFIRTPLEFTSFPTVLLITTALRLGLNVASTRLILSHGHEGTDAAGNIIEAFGHFIIQDNFVVGGVVFGIGNTVHEALRYDADGQLLTGTLMDYALPYAPDAPPIDGFYQEIPAKTNPLGLRGLGECGNPGIGAAVAGAIVDAMGDPASSIRALPAQAGALHERE